MIRISHLHKRSDHFCIKLGIIGTVNAVLQFFFRKIGKEFFHNLVSSLLIRHTLQFVHRNIQFRNSYRYEQTTIICKSF